MALLLLKSIADADQTPSQTGNAMVYLIDEPELHLHPKALEALGALLLEESKTKQIFISTHSPYLYKSLYKEGAVYIARRGTDGKADIKQLQNGNGLFPWSPSWGEINYYAFGMPTVELHNELYGYLQECSQKFKLDEFDDFLATSGLIKSKKWIKSQNGNLQSAFDATLPTYIRNSIHHPENRSNASWSSDELKSSIDLLIDLLARQEKPCA